MPSFSRQYLNHLSFGSAALQTIRRLGEARGRQQLFVSQYPQQLDRLRAYSEFEERVETLKGSKTDQVRQAVSRRIGSFTISDLEADCPGVSRDMVRHVLRQMKREGAIAVEGHGRGARWRRS